MNLRKDHYRIVKGERRSCVCARHFLPPPPFVRGGGISPRGCLIVERHPVTNCCAQRTPTPRPWTVGQVANVGINGVTHIWVGFRPATAPWLEALGRPWPDSVAGPPSTRGKAERERSVTSVEGEAARCRKGTAAECPPVRSSAQERGPTIARRRQVLKERRRRRRSVMELAM